MKNMPRQNPKSSETLIEGLNPDAPNGAKSHKKSSVRSAPVLGVIDLGTNNCRMMIASVEHGQLKIIESFSRIVRLGQGLEREQALSEAAQNRAIAALKVCADKIKRYSEIRIRAVATQACRLAQNAHKFLGRVFKETGIRFEIITAEHEARLSVTGCTSLFDAPASAAIVIDVGGGSTEISWLDLRGVPVLATQSNQVRSIDLLVASQKLKAKTWVSIPKGVVNLSERFEETKFANPEAWYEAMVNDFQKEIPFLEPAEALRSMFENQQAFIIGTSGAVTSLAGLHLNLDRYDRTKVDGQWISATECRVVTNRLIAMGLDGREAEPCIGRDRADLVLAGAAILEALLRAWPCERIRVADRGLREGLLLSMLKKRPAKKRKRPKKPYPQPLPAQS